MADTPDHPFGRRPNRNTTGRRNGASPGGMGTRPVPMDDIPSEPPDLVAVQADDELISALAAGLQVSAPGHRGYDADDHVAAMLAAWKADIDADPVPDIDLDEAVGAALSGRRPSGRLRHLVPVASAAALIVVAITGVSIAAHDTRPGDPLFSVSKVLYAEEAASYEALETVEQSRELAKQALAVGDKEAAEAAVAEGQAAAEKVLAEHGRGEVEQRLHKLEVVVEDTEPGVPTFVEDEPSRGGGSPDENEPGTAAPSTTSSQEPSSGGGSADPSESGDEPGTQDPDTQDPGSSGDPPPDPRSSAGSPSGSSGGPGTDGPGTSDPGTSDPGTSEPGTSEPGTSEPDAQQSDSPAGEASKPAAQPNVEGDPSSDPSSQPSSQPSADQSAEEPTSPPTTTKPPVTREGTSGRSGISGASMSATGTATPSGEPTT